jgi:hypothetical protein
MQGIPLSPCSLLFAPCFTGSLMTDLLITDYCFTDYCFTDY